MKKQHTKIKINSRERKIRPEELGQKGEARFLEICADARLIANKSSWDFMGWDYLIEFPYDEPMQGEILDARPHPQEAKIQIKTIWADKKSVKLRLSAAERLARSALPSFVLVLIVNDDLSFSKAIIFHMMDKNLEKILKKLREVSLESSLLINKTNIEFHLRDGIEFDVTGDALGSEISGLIGDYDHYIPKKKSQLQNIGFNDVRYEGKFTLNLGSHAEFSEYLLGMRDVPISNLEVNEVRFGISVPQITGQAGIARITPNPAANCIVSVYSTSRGRAVRAPGVLYVAPKNSDGKNTPYRIDTKLLKFLSTGDGITIRKIENILDAEGSASEIRNNILLWNYLISGPSDLSLAVGGRKVIGAFINLPNYETVDWLPNVVNELEIFERILHNIGAEKPNISINSVHKMSMGLYLIDSLLRCVNEFSISNITLEGNDDINFANGKEAMLVYQLFNDNFGIGFYAILDVDIEIDGKNAHIKVIGISLREIRLMSTDGIIWDAFVEEARATIGIPLEIHIRTPTGEIV